MERFLWTIRWPLVVEVLNGVSVQIGGGAIWLAVSYGVSALAAFWGGWLVMKEPWGSLARSAWVGPVLLLIGFVMIGGLSNLLFGDFREIAKTLTHDWLNETPRLAYLLGVVLSFLMFAPVAALISLLGGALGRVSRRANAT